MNLAFKAITELVNDTIAQNKVINSRMDELQATMCNLQQTVSNMPKSASTAEVTEINMKQKHPTQTGDGSQSFSPEAMERNVSNDTYLGSDNAEDDFNMILDVSDDDDVGDEVAGKEKCDVQKNLSPSQRTNINWGDKFSSPTSLDANKSQRGSTPTQVVTLPNKGHEQS